MASTTFKTIMVQGHMPVRKEAKAAEAITPGHLLNFTGANVRKHNTAAGFLQGKMVALETQTPDSDGIFGIDVAYATNDRTYYAVGTAGERYNMLLKAGENAAQGAVLVSAGDGSLQVHTVSATTLENSVVGFAVNAVNNTAGVTAVRVLVEIV